MNRHKKQQMIIICLIFFFTAALIWGWTPTNYANCGLDQNAAWISVNWAAEPTEETALKQLNESVQSRQISYLYPYITYLKADGSFNQTYTYAKTFVTQYRQYNPNTKFLAWVGLPLKNDRSIGVQGWVDLSNNTTRETIVQFIVEIINQSGFDGVHINAETVKNNDQHFLTLLDEVRNALDQDKILSIAGSHWYPEAVNILPVIRDFRWTGTYYQEIANRVDQITVMAYDSHIHHPALYRLWGREQVKGISRVLLNTEVSLLFGLSVSHENTDSHNQRVENLTNGLAGICAGSIKDRRINGIAIYANWDFDNIDLDIWQAWLK